MSDDCIFCKIIKKEIPSYPLYEDDDVLAFLDVFPSVEGHTLIIPKEHHQNVLETPSELIAKIARVAQKIAPVIIKTVNAPSFHFTNNCGPVAGQTVFHTHFHILPRKEGDGKELWGGGEGNPEELTALKEKIVEAL